MDRGKVGAAHYLAAPTAAPTSEQLYARLGAYWRALGVTDPDQVTALSEQALRRLSELPETPGLDPLARAIVAAGDLLDGETESAFEELNSALAEPTPAPGPGSMPAQRIDLFWLLGPLRRLWRRET